MQRKKVGRGKSIGSSKRAHEPLHARKYARVQNKVNNTIFVPVHHHACIPQQHQMLASNESSKGREERAGTIGAAAGPSHRAKQSVYWSKVFCTSGNGLFHRFIISAPCISKPEPVGVSGIKPSGLDVHQLDHRRVTDAMQGHHGVASVAVLHLLGMLQR